MPKIIQLTQHETRQFIYLNVDHIVSFYRKDRTNYSFVNTNDAGGGNQWSVHESPAKIAELIRGEHMQPLIH